jgi:outer membrane protein assembly factor BamD
MSARRPNTTVAAPQFMIASGAMFRVGILVALLLACGGPPPKSPLTYTEESRKAYDQAMQEFESHNWLESQALFRDVRKKYAFSKYARLSELRIADADFEQDKFVEAVREYRQFIHDHRADSDEVSYASARIAEAQYKEIGDSFLAPSTDERDQGIILDAYRELRLFLSNYPDSKEAPKSRKLLADVTARLIRHELYVARFYLQRENFDAAVLRIQYALRTFASNESAVGKTQSVLGEVPASGMEPEALLLLGEVFLQMKKPREARDAFISLIRDHAASPLVIPAKKYLAFLQES